MTQSHNHIHNLSWMQSCVWILSMIRASQVDRSLAPKINIEYFALVKDHVSNLIKNKRTFSKRAHDFEIFVSLQSFAESLSCITVIMWPENSNQNIYLFWKKQARPHPPYPRWQQSWIFCLLTLPTDPLSHYQKLLFIIASNIKLGDDHPGHIKISKYKKSFYHGGFVLALHDLPGFGIWRKSFFFRVKEDISKHTVWKVIVIISTKRHESESSTIKVWLTELLQNKDAFPLREALADVFQTDKELHTCRYIFLPVFVIGWLGMINISIATL